MAEKKDLEKDIIPIYDPRMTFCDSLYINQPDNKEYFDIAFASGGAIIGRYALTPKHAKRLLLLLEKEIGVYEKIEGEIVTQLPETNQ